MTAFLDTSVLIDHSRGVQAAYETLAKTAGEGELHSSEMVRTELLIYIREQELAAITPLLEVILWHPVDRQVAELAGALGRRWLPSHNRTDAADFIIAATATLLGAELLTQNVKHFPMFERLEAAY